MEEIFIQLALILSAAFIVSYIVRQLKQPIILGYIIAGILISPFILSIGTSQETIHIFSKLGIAFLLFIVGLHLNPKVIREIGMASLFVGLAQIIFTFLFGFLISSFMLQLPMVTSAYIGIALAFSSTIIVMKLLSDNGNLDSLYGKISIGILIIQDLVAVGVLMFISSFSNPINLTSFALKSVLGGFLLILILFLFGIFIMPKFTRSIARSQELLFLFSICWCFVIAALFNYIGFSIEIGALIAGVILSLSPYSIEISSKIHSIRDFFLIIFFIILGLNIQIENISSTIFNSLILSAFVLIFKPLILMSFLRFFGYTKRTNFLVGTTLSQISEFSLIVLGLGVSLGHISQEILSTLTLTGLITITISTYFFIYSTPLYSLLKKFLGIFEKSQIRRERKLNEKYDAILFGYNRIGFSILKSLKQLNKKYLVVDFNPDVIAGLSKVRVPCIYGDAYDSDLLEDLPLNKIKIAVSTIPDYEINSLLIYSIKRVNKDAIIILRAHTIEEALDLYKQGASYVLTPHFLGGEYVSKMIRTKKVNESGYNEERQKHIRTLKEINQKGLQHPKVEKN